jgi:hypothetical protein
MVVFGAERCARFLKSILRERLRSLDLGLVNLKPEQKRPAGKEVVSSPTGLSCLLQVRTAL